jgi:hypothetical protein
LPQHKPTSAGLRRKRESTVPRAKGLSKGQNSRRGVDTRKPKAPRRKSKASTRQPKPSKAIPEAINIDTEDEDASPPSQVGVAQKSTPTYAAANSPVESSYLTEAQLAENDPQKALFEISSAGGPSWSFSLIHGPIRPFPDHLARMIQEWEQIHRGLLPPFFNITFLDTAPCWVSSTMLMDHIFSMDGERLQVSFYAVVDNYRGCDAYAMNQVGYVAVPFSEKEPPRLAQHIRLVHQPFYSKLNESTVSDFYYFVTWL